MTEQIITVEQFESSFPGNTQSGEWVEALNLILPKYEINTSQRLIAFLTQCGHESAGFTRLVENLNYSAAALVAHWPKRFDAQTAKAYQRKADLIANRAYADRLGNGNEQSGDGWTYRGRGVIQLTGKANYQAFADHLGKTLEAVVVYLETKAGAVESACWFWQKHGLNGLADIGDVKQMTRVINGGYNGLAERYELTEWITGVFTA